MICTQLRSSGPSYPHKKRKGEKKWCFVSLLSVIRFSGTTKVSDLLLLRFRFELIIVYVIFLFIFSSIYPTVTVNVIKFMVLESFFINAKSKPSSLWAFGTPLMYSSYLFYLTSLNMWSKLTFSYLVYARWVNFEPWIIFQEFSLEKIFPSLSD